MIYLIFGFIIVFAIIDWIYINYFKRTKNVNNIIQDIKTGIKLPSVKIIAPRGIITVITDDTVNQILLLLATLKYLNCSLPIILYFSFDFITQDNIKYLSKIIPQIHNKCILADLVKVCKCEMTINESEIYALIFAPFEQIIKISPDLLFFFNPEFIFNDPDYVYSGALFWRDTQKFNMILGNSVYNWIRHFIPYDIPTNDIIEKKSVSLVSNGLMIFNRKTHNKTLQNLLIFLKHKDIPLMHKEWGWFCSEVAQEKYVIGKQIAGIIGENVGEFIIGGHVLYVGKDGQFIAWDKSIFNRNSYATEFTHYSLSEDNVWFGNRCKCGKVDDIKDSEKKLINDYGKIYQKLRYSLFKALS